MDDRSALAWLARRAGFGLAPMELDAQVVAGVASTLDRLVDPDRQGVAPAPDPWATLDLSGIDPRNVSNELRGGVISGWLGAMATTPRPLMEWMRWFWHGHFVTSQTVVHDPRMIVTQLRMLGDLAMGDFRTLLRAVTVDPAMLVYLDGTRNRRHQLNENYAREVLELFSLGIGSFSEDDVGSSAHAFTGWYVDVRTGESRFAADRHDDTLQQYLGRAGVHDVETAIDAIVEQSACAPFITARLARALLGPEVDSGLIDRLAGEFRQSGLQIRPLVRSILEVGLDGASTSMITTPVPWAVAASRATGFDLTARPREVINALRAAGQLPTVAPNVGGWPSGRAWLTSSATMARVEMSGGLAAAAAIDNPARVAAAAGDLDGLADALGRPEGFEPATRAGLRSLGSGPDRSSAVLTVALASPDLVVV